MRLRGVYRLLEGLGHRCLVAAPSKLSRAPGDRVKNDKSDARLLAVSLRAGLVVPVWVPDQRHEAVRGLVRGRRAAVKARKSERQRLTSLLLVHGRCYAGKARWTRPHWAWLADQRFEDPALQLVKQDAIEAIRYNEERVKLLTTSMLATAKNWHLAPAVAALQALYGINAVAAVILMAEIGDPRRFASASAVVAYLGLRPSEESSGDRLRRGSITKAGNAEARRVLIEAAWCYRLPPQVSKAIEGRREGLPAALRAKVWKTHNRLYRRYWHLRKVGNKRSTVAVTAVARELAGVVWGGRLLGDGPEPRPGGRGVARRRRPGDRAAGHRRRAGGARPRADAGRGGGGNRRSRTRSIRRSSNRAGFETGTEAEAEIGAPTLTAD